MKMGMFVASVARKPWSNGTAKKLKSFGCRLAWLAEAPFQKRTTCIVAYIYNLVNS